MQRNWQRKNFAKRRRFATGRCMPTESRSRPPIFRPEVLHMRRCRGLRRPDDSARAQRSKVAKRATARHSGSNRILNGWPEQAKALLDRLVGDPAAVNLQTCPKMG